MLEKVLITVFMCLMVYETIKVEHNETVNSCPPFHSQGDTAGSSCKTSYECGKGFCCRDASNKVLSSNPQFIGILGSSTGTCVVGKASKGEVCDTDCQCDTGLMCYRPMSGVCCPPKTCHDSAYVIKQQEYWRNCLSNPKCALPP